MNKLGQNAPSVTFVQTFESLIVGNSAAFHYNTYSLIQGTCALLTLFRQSRQEKPFGRVDFPPMVARDNLQSLIESVIWELESELDNKESLEKTKVLPGNLAEFYCESFFARIDPLLEKRDSETWMGTPSSEMLFLNDIDWADFDTEI
jgi:hypothetical protein